MQTLEWSAHEYEEKDRSRDWFWALGVIVFTATVAAIIYGNYFFAALIFLSGVLLGSLAVKKPDVVSYKMTDAGLQVGSALYPYENIKSFWVQEENIQEENGEMLKPTLFVHSTRAFMPIMMIPIENALAGKIRAVMLEKKVLEEEMKEHVSMKIMDALGF